MSEDLTKQQQILMWELFAAGGEKLLKDVEPKPRGTPHHALARKGFLKTSKHARSILIVLEDRGWRWIADSDPFPIAPNEKRVTAERRLLQSLLRSIKRYSADHGQQIQGLFRPAAASHDDTSDIEKHITAAFFDIAGRPARGNIRLSQLRSKLNHIDRAKVDAALVAMWRAKRANLMNLDNPRDIETEGDAALKTGIHTFHVVRIAE